MTREPLTFAPATPELLARFYGKPAPFTLRGHVALIGDRVVGVGGVSYVDGLPIAFTDMGNELRASIKDRARCFRFLEAAFAKWEGPLFAICNPQEPTARHVLERLGFRGPNEMMARPG